MFFLIQKALRAAKSFDAVSRRVTKLETALAEISSKLERFEKLCLTLDYAQHLVSNSRVKKNIRDALRACAWIYSENKS